jgi:hypothetical protein
MNVLKASMILLVFSLMITAVSEKAYAGRSIGDLLPYITIEGNAKGTKWVGPLTAYYEIDDDNSLSCPVFTTKIYFFVRLRHGFDIRGYSGETQNICLTNYDGQIEALSGFITNEVIPTLAPTGTPWKIKSIDALVEDDQSVSGTGPVFSILDLTIAVQD